MKWLKPLIDLILYSNLWIACCAAAMTFQSYFLYDLYGSPLPLTALVFFSTLFLYALHRIVGISKVHEFIEDFERYQVIAKYRHHIIVYAVLAAIGGAVSFFYVSLSVKLALIVPALLSLAYVLPVFGNGKRLRDFDGVKIFLIAIVWAYITVVLPFIEASFALTDYATEEILFLAAERAVFIFTITLPFDIRDLKVDAHSGVSTLPAKLGSQKTKVLGWILCFLGVCLASGYHAFGIITYPILLAFFLSYLLTAVVLYFSDRIKHDYFFTGVVDGLMLVQFGLVLWMGSY